MHLSGAQGAEQTPTLEYVHRVLNQIGVNKPMWLHGRLAMFASQETWWRRPRLGLTQWLASAPLPFDAMTDAFPHAGTDETFAVAAYYQSEMMVMFLRERAPMANFGPVVEAMAYGRVDPREAFGRFCGLEGSALSQACPAYVKEP